MWLGPFCRFSTRRSTWIWSRSCSLARWVVLFGRRVRGWTFGFVTLASVASVVVSCGPLRWFEQFGRLEVTSISELRTVSLPRTRGEGVPSFSLSRQLQGSISTRVPFGKSFSQLFEVLQAPSPPIPLAALALRWLGRRLGPRGDAPKRPVARPR